MIEQRAIKTPDSESEMNQSMKIASSKSGQVSRKKLRPYVCVHCGTPAPALYRHLSSSRTVASIQAVSCKHCFKPVDPYTEREWLLVVIDMILMRQEAYRHVLYNINEMRGISTRRLMQFLLAWTIFDAYLKWEAHHIKLVESGERDMRMLQNPTFVVALGCTSLASFLVQWLCNLVYMELIHSPAMELHPNYHNALYWALLLPSSFAAVMVLVTIWENTKTIRLLGSIMVAYWQIIAVSVVTENIYTPLLGVFAGIMYKWSAVIMLATLYDVPAPCLGLEIDLRKLGFPLIENIGNAAKFCIP